VQGFIGPVREDQAQCPQADQQEGHEGQNQEESQAGGQEAAVVSAEALEDIEDEFDQKDALQTHQYCVHGDP